MNLRNIKGTTENRCHCESWLEHWKQYARHRNRKDPPTCSVAFCKNTDIVGAHVQIEDDDDTWYIVPLCNAHNQRTTRLSVQDSTPLAPANISMTCGRR